MRIAFISEHASQPDSADGPEAGEHDALALACALARMGHHVDVLAPRDTPGQGAAADVRPGVRMLHLDVGAPRSASSPWLPQLDHFLASARGLLAHSVPYDVLHAHDLVQGLVGLSLKRTFAIPLITTPGPLLRARARRAGDALERVRTPFERQLAQRSDAIVAASPQERADIVRRYGAHPQRVHVVSRGVDPRVFSPASRQLARRDLGLCEDEFVALHLGDLHPHKGVDNVLRSLACVPRAARLRLLVAHDGPAGSPEPLRLGEIARQCGVADRVSFVQVRCAAERRAFYAAADVLVATPWFDCGCGAPLEAMACGTPVIGSHLGALCHWVDDGVTGFLVPPHEPQALAAALCRLQAHPPLARAFGLASLRRARSRFTWDCAADEMTRVYASAWSALRRASLKPRLALVREASPGDGARA